MVELTDIELATVEHIHSELTKYIIGSPFNIILENTPPADGNNTIKVCHDDQTVALVMVGIRTDHQGISHHDPLHITIGLTFELLDKAIQHFYLDSPGSLERCVSAIKKHIHWPRFYEALLNRVLLNATRGGRPLPE